MHKSENRKPTFDLALGFEIDYQCESSYFNLVRESVQKKHSKSKTEGSASPDIGPYITADFSRFQIFTTFDHDENAEKHFLLLQVPLL
jgi:hypothetical protein